MSWGTVTTLKAPLHDIALFAAHHLYLGCAALYLYLDAPCEGLDTLSHPRLHLREGSQSNAALHRRQMANAQDAYVRADVAWLAHIDIDEFLLANDSVEAALAQVPPEHDWLRLPTLEALLPPETEGPIPFKRAPQLAGRPRAVLEELYPDYGLHLRTGYLSHSEGKPFARTGLKGARLGIHKLLGKVNEKPYVAENMRLGHFHASTLAQFQAELPRRLADTSYVAARTGQLSIADLIALLHESEGERGPKALYTALRSTAPAHLNALEAQGMLARYDLQLAQKARTLFGNAVLDTSA